MKIPCLAWGALCTLLLTGIAPAQITQINAMTNPHGVIDMDAVGPVGPTSVGAIAAAATIPTSLLNVTLTPNGVAAGVYNTNPGQGRALALDANGNLALIDPPSGAFTAYDAVVDLSVPSNEFGCSIGDWNGAMILELFSAGTSLGTISLDFSGGGIRYLHSVVPFDSVGITCSSTGGNWVICDLVVEAGSPPINPTLILSVFGGGLLQIIENDLQAGAETFTLITVNDPCPTGPGTGPFLGLCASNPATFDSLVLQVTSPMVPGNPFHFPAPASSVTLGPYVLPPGLYLEAVCFYFLPGGAAYVSNVDFGTTL